MRLVLVLYKWGQSAIAAQSAPAQHGPNNIQPELITELRIISLDSFLCRPGLSRNVTILIGWFDYIIRHLMPWTAPGPCLLSMMVIESLLEIMITAARQLGSIIFSQFEETSSSSSSSDVRAGHQSGSPEYRMSRTDTNCLLSPSYTHTLDTSGGPGNWS